MKKFIFLLLIVTNTINAQVPSYVPTNGLVGYWPFNGNANDESGNGNNGVVNGATLATDRMGNIDSAYNFDGIFDYISINNSPSLNIIGTQITLSFWLYSNSDANDANYKGISKGGYDVGSGYEFLYRNSFNNDNGVISITGGTGIQACDLTYNMNEVFGQWTHLAVTLNNGTANFYVNGVYQISNNVNQISEFVSNSSNLFFGKRNPSNSYAGFLQGKMDDIGIWNRALTQQEITNLYNSANTNECLTMVINTGALSTNPVTYTSSVSIYPNPANDQITIDCGNLANVVGWNIKITNMMGQEVFNQPMNTQQYVVPLNTWTGQGMYFVKILNAQNEVVNIKKIILQ